MPRAWLGSDPHQPSLCLQVASLGGFQSCCHCGNGEPCAMCHRVCRGTAGSSWKLLSSRSPAPGACCMVAPLAPREPLSLSSPVTWGLAHLQGTRAPALLSCQGVGGRKERGNGWLGCPCPGLLPREHILTQAGRTTGPRLPAVSRAAREGGRLPSFARRTVPVCVTGEPVTLAIRLLLGLSTRKAGSFRN